MAARVVHLPLAIALTIGAVAPASRASESASGQVARTSPLAGRLDDPLG